MVGYRRRTVAIRPTRPGHRTHRPDWPCSCVSAGRDSLMSMRSFARRRAALLHTGVELTRELVESHAVALEGLTKERASSRRKPTLSCNLHSSRSFTTSGAALSCRQSTIIATSAKARSPQHRTFPAWSPRQLAVAERQPPLANAPPPAHNASAAEIGLLHAIVVRKVSGVAAHRHATGLKHVRAIRDGKRHTRVLLDQ